MRFPFAVHDQNCECGRPSDGPQIIDARCVILWSQINRWFNLKQLTSQSGMSPASGSEPTSTQM